MLTRKLNQEDIQYTLTDLILQLSQQQDYQYQLVFTKIQMSHYTDSFDFSPFITLALPILNLFSAHRKPGQKFSFLLLQCLDSLTVLRIGTVPFPSNKWKYLSTEYPHSPKQLQCYKLDFREGLPTAFERFESLLPNIGTLFYN